MNESESSNIAQLDGNVSICSDTVRQDNYHTQQVDDNNSIISFDETQSSVSLSPRPKCKRLVAAAHLPAVACYNMRSIFPKIRNVRADMLERGISVGFFSEVWEKAEKKSHKSEIENLLQSYGLKYISTARPRGWGGAAIICNQQSFSLEKIDITIPHNLEVVWGLLRSKYEEAKK